jgi:hypothetical protein
MLLPKSRGISPISAYSLSLALAAFCLTVMTVTAAAQQSQNVAPRAGATSLEQIEAQRRQLFARMMEAPDDLDTAFEYTRTHANLRAGSAPAPA